MKRKLLIAIAWLSTAMLTGCTNGGGGGFDIVKFLQNPIVMILLAIFIVYWMMKRGK